MVFDFTLNTFDTTSIPINGLPTTYDQRYVYGSIIHKTSKSTFMSMFNPNGGGHSIINIDISNNTINVIDYFTSHIFYVGTYKRYREYNLLNSSERTHHSTGQFNGWKSSHSRYIPELGKLFLKNTYNNNCILELSNKEYFYWDNPTALWKLGNKGDTPKISGKKRGTFKLDSVTNGEVYSLDIDGVTYSHTATDTLQMSVLNGLSSQINADINCRATSTVTDSNSDYFLNLEAKEAGVDYNEYGNGVDDSSNNYNVIGPGWGHPDDENPTYFYMSQFRTKGINSMVFEKNGVPHDEGLQIEFSDGGVDNFIAGESYSVMCSRGGQVIDNSQAWRISSTTPYYNVNSQYIDNQYVLPLITKQATPNKSDDGFITVLSDNWSEYNILKNLEYGMKKAYIGDFPNGSYDPLNNFGMDVQQMENCPNSSFKDWAVGEVVLEENMSGSGLSFTLTCTSVPIRPNNVVITWLDGTNEESILDDGTGTFNAHDSIDNTTSVVDYSTGEITINYETGSEPIGFPVVEYKPVARGTDMPMLSGVIPKEIKITGWFLNDHIGTKNNGMSLDTDSPNEPHIFIHPKWNHQIKMMMSESEGRFWNEETLEAGSRYDNRIPVGQTRGFYNNCQLLITSGFCDKEAKTKKFNHQDAEHEHLRFTDMFRSGHGRLMGNCWGDSIDPRYLHTGDVLSDAMSSKFSVVAYQPANETQIWEASTEFTVGQKIRPTTYNRYSYNCTTAGISGTSEPAWSSTNNDGTVAWSRYIEEIRINSGSLYTSDSIYENSHGNRLVTCYDKDRTDKLIQYIGEELEIKDYYCDNKILRLKTDTDDWTSDGDNAHQVDDPDKDNWELKNVSGTDYDIWRESPLKGTVLTLKKKDGSDDQPDEPQSITRNEKWRYHLTSLEVVSTTGFNRYDTIEQENTTATAFIDFIDSGNNLLYVREVSGTFNTTDDIISPATTSITTITQNTNITGTITYASSNKISSDILNDLDRYLSKFLIFKGNITSTLEGETVMLKSKSGYRLSIYPNFSTTPAVGDEFIIIDAMPMKATIRNIGRTQIIDSTIDDSDNNEYSVLLTLNSTQSTIERASDNPDWVVDSLIDSYIIFTVGTCRNVAHKIISNTERTLTIDGVIQYKLNEEVKFKILGSSTASFYMGKYNILYV